MELVASLLLVLFYISSASSCPSGWIRVNNACFLAVHEPKASFEGATIECMKKGATLASIHSVEEHEAVADVIMTDRSYYIGLTDIGLERTFVWMDGTPVNYTNWAEGQPNEGYRDQDCAVLWLEDSEKKWNDYRCHNLLSYICGKRLDDIIIVTDLLKSTIMAGPVATLDLVEIPLHNVGTPEAVYYNPVEHNVYWTDSQRKTINKAFLNGTEQKEVLSFLSDPKGITIDVENQHIYWTDDGTDRIERANLDGSEVQVIIEDDLDKPHAIVIDSAREHIYWTDLGNITKIERSNAADGSERVAIVTADLQKPNGLDIDIKAKRLYWCDADLNRIETTDLNGRDRKILFSITKPNINPFDIVIYKNNIYWSDWTLNRLCKLGDIVNYEEPKDNFSAVGPAVFRRAGGLHIQKEFFVGHMLSLPSIPSPKPTTGFTKENDTTLVLPTGPTNHLISAGNLHVSASSSKVSMNTVLPSCLLPIIIVVVGIIIAVLLRRGKRNGFDFPLIQDSGIRFEVNVLPETTENKNHTFPDTATVVKDDFTFPRNQLHIMRELGSGQFGRVLLAATRDVKMTNGTIIPNKVAVKTLREGVHPAEKENFLRELDLMKKLKPHPNVIGLLGGCTEKEPYYIVVEYMAQGNLKRFLNESRLRNLNNIRESDERSRLTQTQLLLFAKQVADGMAFIATNECIHRDLAARNVLVGEDLTCRVSDFGLARDVANIGEYKRQSDTLLPIRWMAIESFVSDVHTIESDVWSYGILLWEIVTLGATPYPGMRPSTIIRNMRQGYHKPMPKPTHCQQDVYDIMVACWRCDPSTRPTFTQLSQNLDRLLEIHSDYLLLDEIEESIYDITAVRNKDERV